jgi:endonuclease/exonuclease/phosphatase family metal-dependent hydrolase
MPRTLLICLLALLMPLLSASPTGAARQWIRIGSWNIQNLGVRPWGQHPKAVAEHLLLAGVDLIALQEIHDTDGDASRRSNAVLDEALDLINHQECHDWTYRLFPKADPSDTRQLTGVAWNRRVLTLAAPPTAVSRSPKAAADWLRPPYAVQFTTGPGTTDMIIVPVHLKANTDGEATGRRFRSKEAKRLVDALDRVCSRFHDKDIIVLGDTNCLSGREAALQTLAAAGWRDLNSSDQATFRTGNAPFDRILVPRRQPEFRFSRQYILSPGDAADHFRAVSDHYVVMTTVRVMPDDD